MASPTVKLPSAIQRNDKNKKAADKYPVYRESKELVNTAVDLHREIEAKKGDLERVKAQITEQVFPVMSEAIREKGCDQTGVSAVGDKGTVLVVWKNDFRSGADLAAVDAVIGEDLREKTFRQRLSFKVNGDTLVGALGASKTSKFVAELYELFKKHGVEQALSTNEDFVPVSVHKLFAELPLDKAKDLNETFKFPSSASVKVV